MLRGGGNKLAGPDLQGESQPLLPCRYTQLLLRAMAAAMEVAGGKKRREKEGPRKPGNSDMLPGPRACALSGGFIHQSRRRRVDCRRFRSKLFDASTGA